MEALAALAKLALYFALACGAGQALAAFALRRNTPDPELLRRVAARVRVGAALAVAAEAAVIATLTARLGDFDVATLSIVANSTSGAAAAVILAGSATILLARGKGAAAALGGVLSLASFALVGHGPGDGILGSALAALHVAAAMWWIGALFVLIPALGVLPQAAIVALVRSFSRIAMAIVGALGVLGLALLALLSQGELAALTSPWGLTLALKLTAAAAALGLAIWNKLRLTPALEAPDPAKAAKAVDAMARSIRIELCGLALALTATAALTTWTSPHGD